MVAVDSRYLYRHRRLITAVTGLIIALNQTGLISVFGPRQSSSIAVHMASPRATPRRGIGTRVSTPGEISTPVSKLQQSSVTNDLISGVWDGPVEKGGSRMAMSIRRLPNGGHTIHISPAALHDVIGEPERSTSKAATLRLA